MELTQQRGAIALTLDRSRILFFDNAATFLLVDRYGLGFATELYSIIRQEGERLELKLKSKDALSYFLWAGLQREAAECGETLTPVQVDEMLRPWTFAKAFQAVVQALSGAWDNPPQPGKDDAASLSPRPVATKTPAKKVQKRTSTRRSGSRTGA